MALVDGQMPLLGFCGSESDRAGSSLPPVIHLRPVNCVPEKLSPPAAANRLAGNVILKAGLVSLNDQADREDLAQRRIHRLG